MPSDAPTPLPPHLTVEQSKEVARRRRGRNLALLLVLLTLSLLFYAVAFVRIGPH